MSRNLFSYTNRYLLLCCRPQHYCVTLLHYTAVLIAAPRPVKTQLVCASVPCATPSAQTVFSSLCFLLEYFAPCWHTSKCCRAYKQIRPMPDDIFGCTNTISCRPLKFQSNRSNTRTSAALPERLSNVFKLFSLFRMKWQTTLRPIKNIINSCVWKFAFFKQKQWITCWR